MAVQSGTSANVLERAVEGGVARRTNAERSAATRAKLIEAAIDCLHRNGYAATTTVGVAERAGVSRGAMLHQFPTKVELMLAVAEFVVDAQNEHRRAKLLKVNRGRDRFIAATEVTWETFSQPPAIALLEIMMGSRSDPELARRFPAIGDRLERMQGDALWEVAADIGITDREAVDTLVRLNLAAMRGLSIELMFTRDKAAIRRAVDLLKKQKIAFTDELLAKSAAKPEGGAGRP